MRWTIDSIEEGIASVEQDGGQMLILPLALFPDGAREGDILSVERKETRGRVTLRIAIDRTATDRAYRASERQVRKKSGPRAVRDPGGDVEL
jgi:hypothetical protein